MQHSGLSVMCQESMMPTPDTNAHNRALNSLICAEYGGLSSFSLLVSHVCDEAGA
jgi:hypothetical protein